MPGYVISGQVTLASTGAGVSGVNINASGSQYASATTDANGRYSLPGLPAGGNFTVTAFKGGYSLSGAQTFNSFSANQTASFTATSALSINGGSSSARVESGTNLSMAFNLSSPNGANDVNWAQFYFADSGGNAYCLGDWGRPNALFLYDGNTGVTSGFGIDQNDSFCTVSLTSITNSSTDPTQVTVVLNFNFAAGLGGDYTVLTQINYGSGEAGSWTALGTITIDPARQPVLSPPVDEPPPTSAPIPRPASPVSASRTNCNDISGVWAGPTGSDSTYSISTSEGTLTSDSSWTFCQVTTPMTGFRQTDGTWQVNIATDVYACGKQFSPMTAIVTSGCTSATITESGSTSSSTQTSGFSAFATRAASPTTTWTRSGPPGITTTVDLMAGTITTRLTGQNKASNLVISVNSSQGQQTPLPSHSAAQSGNSYTDRFRLNLPPGQYGNVVATWNTTSLTVPVAFYVVGRTRLTQYNTPYEKNCSDNPRTAYIINKIDKAADGYCYWKTVQLGSQFVTQVITNGTGVIGTDEIVKSYSAGAKSICYVPTNGTFANSFFSVDTGGKPITKIKGSHNTVLSDATGTINSKNENNPAAGSIAVLPNESNAPTAPAFPFVFGDQLLLIDQNDVNDPRGPRSVEDYCPGCGPGSFSSPAVAHVDVYNSRQTCGTGSDYNTVPFLTIRLR